MAVVPEMRIPASPVVRRRLLAAELRRLREATGKLADQVARAIGWSPAKISRYELATSNLVPREVAALLDWYKVTGDRRDYLLGLAGDSRTCRGWWEDYDLPATLGEFIGLTEGAAAISEWAQDAVPVLLRTRAYTAALLAARGDIEVLPPAALARRADAEHRRAAILDGDPPPALAVVIAESVLDRRVGATASMAAQLGALAVGRPGVTVQVLPAASGCGVTGGSFTLLQFPGAGPGTVGILPDTTAREHMLGACLDDDDLAAHLHQRAWQQLSAAAAGPEASRDLLAAAAARWAAE
jgi:transcriptional regulator with XRE-family HTH domain